MAKSPINPAGSRAGRGFRYQDAVGALLAVQGWTGASPFGAVTPEAHDDFDLIGAQDRAFVQAKSRRSEAGEFSVSDAAAYIAELWDRHEAAGAPPDSLVLVLERGVRGLALAPCPTARDRPSQGWSATSVMETGFASATARTPPPGSKSGWPILMRPSSMPQAVVLRGISCVGW